MKKILIIGAGIDQVPAIIMARDMGHYVITSDINPNAPGFVYANKSYVVSTNDYKGNLKIATNEKIDGVLTLISETAVPVVGKICEFLNLPGYNSKIALAATNKNAMHRLMEKKNVPMPKSKEVSNVDEALSVLQIFKPPWVLKPSDSSGQRGVVIFNDPKKVDAYLINAMKYSTDNKVVIEEFIEGPEINVTTFMQNGKVHILSLSDRVTIQEPHFGIAIKHITPPNLTPDLIEDVKDIAIQSSLALGLENGITYPQIIANPNGSKLLEIAIRIPGGNMRELALYKSGIDLIEIAIHQALNEPFNIDSLKQKTYPAVYIYHYTQMDVKADLEIFKELYGINEVINLKDVKEVRCHLHKGDKIPKLDWSGSRFASIIIASGNLEDCKKTFDAAYSKLKII